MRTLLSTGRMKPVLMLLSVTLILSGCARMMDLSAKVDYGLCDDPRTPEKWDGLLQPIRWSDDDTDETISQAKANNAQGKALCGDQWGQ
jgi:hypothetical protein